MTVPNSAATTPMMIAMLCGAFRQPVIANVPAQRSARSTRRLVRPSVAISQLCIVFADTPISSGCIARQGIGKADCFAV